MKKTFSVLLLVICFVYSIKGNVDAEICKWIGDKTGWYCDDPTTRYIWRQWNKIINNAHDCNSFCISMGKSNGQCYIANNYDVSSWCNTGQMCICK